MMYTIYNNIYHNPRNTQFSSSLRPSQLVLTEYLWVESRGVPKLFEMQPKFDFIAKMWWGCDVMVKNPTRQREIQHIYVA